MGIHGVKLWKDDIGIMIQRSVEKGNKRAIVEDYAPYLLNPCRKDPGLVNEEKQCLLGALAGFSGKEFGWGGAACTYWSAADSSLGQ